MANPTLNRFEWLKALLQVEGLTATAKNIGTALAVQFANAETGQINPSQETLSDYLKVHRDTIKRPEGAKKRRLAHGNRGRRTRKSAPFAAANTG